MSLTNIQVFCICSVTVYQTRPLIIVSVPGTLCNAYPPSILQHFVRNITISLHLQVCSFSISHLVLNPQSYHNTCICDVIDPLSQRQSASKKRAACAHNAQHSVCTGRSGSYLLIGCFRGIRWSDKPTPTRNTQIVFHLQMAPFNELKAIKTS